MKAHRAWNINKSYFNTTGEILCNNNKDYLNQILDILDNIIESDIG